MGEIVEDLDTVGGRLEAVSFTAVNLPEHARNPIHTDEGAQAAGFPNALVAGVSVYAYMTHVPVVGWGGSWLSSGGAQVRFRSPVFDGDDLVCVPVGADDAWRVDAVVGGQVRATSDVWADATHDPSGPLRRRPGERLEPLEVELDREWIDLAVRLGDPLDIYDRDGVVHPAAWPSIANTVMHTQVVEGAWIHTRSRIHHRSIAYEGEQLVVQGTVFERFDSRVGERAVVDFVMSVGDRVVAEIEHEAIVKVFD